MEEGKPIQKAAIHAQLLLAQRGLRTGLSCALHPETRMTAIRNLRIVPLTPRIPIYL